MLRLPNTEVLKPDSFSVQAKPRGFSQAVYLGFLLFGAVLSLLLFLGAQSYVDSILGTDYKRISQETSERVAKEISELEFSIRTVSTLISLSENIGNKNVSENMQSVGQSLTQFQYVLWLFQDQKQSWKLSPLYADPGAGSAFEYAGLITQPNILRALSQASDGGVGNIRMVTSLLDGSADDGEAGKVLQADNGANLFALVNAVKNRDDTTGYVIGITNFEHVFMQQALNMDKLVSDISIHDVNSGDPLFALSQKSRFGRHEYDVVERYDLGFAGHTFEVISRYFKQDNIFFLESFPFLVLGFCLAITLTGTLYFRMTYFQSLKFAGVNEELGYKNTALEEEIRKRERMSTSAERAEQENRAIIDSVSDVIFETDINSKIMFLNRRWTKITGFEIDQSLGLDFLSVLYPQDFAHLEKGFQALLQGTKSDFRSFTRLRCANGTFRAVELSISMIREDSNGEKRVVGTLTDVEERRRAERALGQAEKKYRNIVENAAGGIFQITPEGLYLSANPAFARILGYDRPEKVLREIKNANQDVYLDAEKRISFMAELDQNGSINNHETQVRCRDGELIWVNENIHAVRDESGNTLYYEGSIEDISGRKESDQVMEDAKLNSDMANRAKSEFLANMSHELRTPLNSIIGFSELIKDEVFGPLEQKAYWEYARDIHDSGQKLLRVINEILDISKIEAGERSLNESMVSIEPVVQSCLDLLSSKIEENEITVTNALVDMPDIICEKLAIKQLVMNLLSNAVKFTPKGGRVTISSEIDREGRLHLAFTDTGIGLDQHEIDKALSPFGQINSELSRSGSGTGLGLTLVDALVKLHGGELELFSQKGIGTTATAIFPAERLVSVAKPVVDVEVDAQPDAVSVSDQG